MDQTSRQPPPRSRTLRKVGLTCAALAALAGSRAATSHLAAQQPQPPVFRAGVDLLTVETSVIDRDGRPVGDLQPADFVVRVDGQPRQVLYARFHGAQAAGVATTPSADTPAAAHMATTDAPGRIVVFVVDRDSLKPGNERAMLRTTSTVFDAMTSSDAVGLVGLPGFAIDLTREHGRVQTALRMMSGTRPKLVLLRERNVTWEEALALERRDPRVTAEVVERECRRFPVGVTNTCPQDLSDQAREMLLTGRGQVQTTMSALGRLADQLAPLTGSKHIILLSGGLPFGQDLLPYFNDFATKAAAAQLVIHAIHLDQPDADASDSRLVASGFGGPSMTAGLGAIAGMSGGTLFNGVGSAAGVFDRVATEINNFYQLGVEARPEDATGKGRDIDVRVGRPNLSVRARRQVVLPDRSTLAARRADPITTLLQQPTDMPDVPVALATFTTRGTEDSTLRVLTSAEIGAAPSSLPAEWGYAVLNEGNVVATGRQRLDLGAPRPQIMTMSANLIPGRYRLRYAVAGADGRAGVGDVPLAVGLRMAGSLQMSDLIVGIADAGRLQPRSRVPQVVPLVAMIEMLSADPALLERTRVVLEVVPAGSAEPVQRVLMAARSGTSAAILLNQAAIDTARLAPGRYSASAIPPNDNQPVGRVTRVFDIAP